MLTNYRQENSNNDIGIGHDNKHIRTRRTHRQDMISTSTTTSKSDEEGLKDLTEEDID